MMQKYIVFSYFDEAQQVFLDIVPARSLAHAVKRLQLIRPYAVIDGGGLLIDQINCLERAGSEADPVLNQYLKAILT